MLFPANLSEETKTNTTKATIYRKQKDTKTQNEHKKLKPGLVSS